MKAERARDRFLPWGGLALGTLGAGLAHQIGAESTFQDCHFSSPGIVIVGTLIGLSLIALGAFASWRVWSGDSETPSRKMVATVSLMASAIFTMAVVLPLIASLVIPRCWE
jgi:hypothetical protein